MKLNNACDIAAAKVLGKPGTVVEYVHGDRTHFKVFGESKVAGRIGIMSRTLGDYKLGDYQATLFRKPL